MLEHRQSEWTAPTPKRFAAPQARALTHAAKLTDIGLERVTHDSPSEPTPPSSRVETGSAPFRPLSEISEISLTALMASDSSSIFQPERHSHNNGSFANLLHGFQSILEASESEPATSIPYHIAPCHTISCHTMPYHLMPHQPIPSHATPCHTISRHTMYVPLRR
jgi:hypothetical protein